MSLAKRRIKPLLNSAFPACAIAYYVVCTFVRISRSRQAPPATIPSFIPATHGPPYYVSGWPFVYRTFSTKNGYYGWNEYPIPYVVNLLTYVVFFAAIVFVCQTARRRKTWQLSLQDLFTLVTFSATSLGVFNNVPFFNDWLFRYGLIRGVPNEKHAILIHLACACVVFAIARIIVTNSAAAFDAMNAPIARRRIAK